MQIGYGDASSPPPLFPLICIFRPLGKRKGETWRTESSILWGVYCTLLVSKLITVSFVPSLLSLSNATVASHSGHDL